MAEKTYTRRALLIRFNMIDSLYWVALSGFMALAVVYARSKGITATQVGLMIAGYRVASFAGQLFWGTLTDRSQENRRFVLLMFVLLALSFLALYFSNSWLAIFISYTAVGFLQLPLNTNMDTWIIRSFGGDSAMLPKVRGISCIAYAAMLLAYSLLIDRVGYWLMPAMLGVFGILMLLLVVDTNPRTALTGRTQHGFSVRDAAQLFKIPGFGFAQLILFALCTGVLTLWIMVTLVLERVGGTAADVSYHTFLMVLVESPGLIIAGKLAFRIRDEHRLMIAILFALAETGLILLAKTPLAAVLTGVLGGISYSFFFASMRSIVQKLVPAELATTAHGVNDAICLSCAGCIGSLGGGVLIDAVGVPVFLVICLCCEAVSFLLLLLYMHTAPARERRRAAQEKSMATQE